MPLITRPASTAVSVKKVHEQCRVVLVPIYMEPKRGYLLDGLIDLPLAERYPSAMKVPSTSLVDMVETLE